MDDLLELLFPDDAELSFKELHTQDPDTIISRLATRGGLDAVSAGTLWGLVDMLTQLLCLLTPEQRRHSVTAFSTASTVHYVNASTHPPLQCGSLTRVWHGE